MASSNPRPRRSGDRSRRPPAATGRGAARRAGRRGGRSPLWIALPIGVVVAVVVALVLVKVVGGGSSSGPSTVSASADPVPAAVLDHVSNVPGSAFDTVGAPAGIVLPSPLKSATPLTEGGKPLVVYVGAEYCPYCAAERWPFVVALSRFGQFSGLKVTHSATQDVYPDTRTFSFVGATYTSQYLALSAVETESNVPSGNGYAPLQKPTPQQTQLVNTYDKAPYVQGQGGIPFLDYGNRYVSAGASYNPQVLAGLTEFQISDALSDPTTQQAQAVDGTANIMTAALCQLTGGQPGSVCSTAGVKAAAARLAAGK